MNNQMSANNQIENSELIESASNEYQQSLGSIIEEFGSETYENVKDFSLDTYEDSEEYLTDVYKGTKNWTLSTGNNIPETANWLGDIYNPTEELADDLYSNVKTMIGETGQSLENLAIQSYETIKDLVFQFGERQSDNSMVLDTRDWHSELNGSQLDVSRHNGSLMLSGDGQEFKQFNPTLEELTKVSEISDYLSQEYSQELSLESQKELEM